MARQPAPFPFDCSIAGAGYMLVPDERDLAWTERRVAEVEQSLPLTGNDSNYTLTPPRVETPYVVDDLSGGIGYPQQVAGKRDVYDFAYKMDCSGGIAVQGPAVSTLGTVTGTHSASHFIEFNDKLYLAVGTRLYAMTDGSTLTLLNTFAQSIGGKCVAFRGTQSASFLFIPQGTSANYYVMSTAEAFTQHASQIAEGFEVINEEIWLHSTESNQRVIRKATDGGTAATWGGPTVIGDGKWNISWMQAVAGRLIVLKDDGLYGPTIQDESVIDRYLTPELNINAASGQCRRPVVFGGELYFQMRGHIYRYNPDSGELGDITPSFGGSSTLQYSNTTAITGQPGVCIWGAAIATIEPLNGGVAGGGYILRYGGWSPSRGQNSEQLREFRPVWHGIVADLNTTSTTTAIFFTNIVPSGGPRLLALAGTSVYYIPLGLFQAPNDDDDYTTTTDSGYVIYPQYTLNTPLETKVLRRVGMVGQNLSAGRSLTAHYRTAITSAFTSIGSVTSDPGTTVAVSGTPSSRAFQFKVVVAGGGTSANYARLLAFAPYSAVRSPSYKEIICQVLTSDNVRDRNGSPARRSGSDLRSALETAIDGSPFTLISPAGESMTVLGLDYEHKLEGFDSTGISRYRTTLRMVEVV